MRTGQTVTLHLLFVIGVGAWAGIAPVRGQSANPVQGSPDPIGDADKGRRLFVKYGCDECHGAEGQGGSPAVRTAVAYGVDIVLLALLTLLLLQIPTVWASSANLISPKVRK